MNLMVFSETSFLRSRPRVTYSSIRVLMNSTIFWRFCPVISMETMDPCLLSGDTTKLLILFVSDR